MSFDTRYFCDNLTFNLLVTIKQIFCLWDFSYHRCRFQLIVALADDNKRSTYYMRNLRLIPALNHGVVLI